MLFLLSKNIVLNNSNQIQWYQQNKQTYLGNNNYLAIQMFY